ncbi:MAG: Gfo/Idh/MocA family oxidoreductase [Phycisphaerales bacterium]|nr:Gfo/Idh/MocA family oxidoreductase [Phycisphaerales bacterium]
MGRHHVRVYSQLPAARLVGVIDQNIERAKALAEPLGVRYAERWTPEFADIAAATIAVPTVHHLAAARPLIERGIGVLIEKPLAPTVAEALEIAALSRRHNCIVHVGHTERFNPAVLAVQRLGIRPKFIESHRISPFTFRSADVGVVFDMMIHDIDVMLHLVRDEVARVDAVGVNVLGPHEDVANVRIACRGGAVADLTASRLALKTERRLRVFAENAYISLDYHKRSGVAIQLDRNLDVIKFARERNVDDLSQLAGVDFGKMVNVEPLTIENSDPLTTELTAFLDAVRLRRSGGGAAGGPQAADVDDGVTAVRVASMIVDAIRAHRWDGAADGRVGLEADIVGAKARSTGRPE